MCTAWVRHNFLWIHHYSLNEVGLENPEMNEQQNYLANGATVLGIVALDSLSQAYQSSLILVGGVCCLHVSA
jgi:hypothetical protein